ncbi:MAG: hypothetical protein WBC02_01975 [Candidatus Aminicenantaceae bacterium]
MEIRSWFGLSPHKDTYCRKAGHHGRAGWAEELEITPCLFHSTLLPHNENYKDKLFG